MLFGHGLRRPVRRAAVPVLFGAEAMAVVLALGLTRTKRQLDAQRIDRPDGTEAGGYVQKTSQRWGEVGG